MGHQILRVVGVGAEAVSVGRGRVRLPAAAPPNRRAVAALPRVWYVCPMSGTPLDTRERAARVQLAAHRAMSGAERYRIASTMSDYARDVALKGLRDRNPGATEAELLLVYIRRLMGWRLPS